MKRIKSKIKIIVTVSLVLITSLVAMQVKASGGEPMEGSRLEQFEKAETPLFDGFAKMDYCLFLETNLDYGVSLDYDCYGIYGDFTRTTQEGEELYFALNEKMIGNKLELYTHQEWNYNTEAFIHDISSDLEWVISRQYTDVPTKLHTDKVYYQGQVLEQKDGDELFESVLFALQRKEDSEAYELMEETKIRKWEELIQLIWGWGDRFLPYRAKSVSAIDEYGKLLAIATPDNECIDIYSMESGEQLQHMDIAGSIDADWPLEVSQIKGNAESGWIVFSNGDVTYRMTYPDGSLEKLGEFMYGTTFSPDGKYLAYCTGNEIMSDLWMVLPKEKLEKWQQMYNRWETTGTGWYVEELETGKKTYIYIEPWQEDYGSTIRGGRCVWLQKDKLLQILNS